MYVCTRAYIRLYLPVHRVELHAGLVTASGAIAYLVPFVEYHSVPLYPQQGAFMQVGGSRQLLLRLPLILLLSELVREDGVGGDHDIVCLMGRCTCVCR